MELPERVAVNESNLRGLREDVSELRGRHEALEARVTVNTEALHTRLTRETSKMSARITKVEIRVAFYAGIGSAFGGLFGTLIGLFFKHVLG